MKKGIKHDIMNGTFGRLRVVADFLPPPDELVLREKKVKITMSLTKRTVDFFKRQAKARQAHYQKLIRRLLDEYVSRHEYSSR